MLVYSVALVIMLQFALPPYPGPPPFGQPLSWSAGIGPLHSDTISGLYIPLQAQESSQKALWGPGLFLSLSSSLYLSDRLGKGLGRHPSYHSWSALSGL